MSVSEIITAEKCTICILQMPRDSMVTQMNTNLKFYKLHEFNLPNNVPLPNWFDPVLPTMTFNTKQQPIKWNILQTLQCLLIQTNWRFIVLPNCLR
jgi:hypothetical protein